MEAKGWRVVGTVTDLNRDSVSTLLNRRALNFVMPATPYYRLAALLLIAAAAQAAFSTRASDQKETPSPKAPRPEVRTAVTITTLRRTDSGSGEQAQLLALQRRTFADARSNARVQMTLARERLREIRFEHASASKEK